MLTLKVNVAVLELIQKMLIHQVIHKHLERSDSDQRPLCEAERHLPDPQVAQIDWLPHLIGRMWTDINPLKSSPF